MMMKMMRMRMMMTTDNGAVRLAYRERPRVTDRTDGSARVAGMVETAIEERPNKLNSATGGAELGVET